MTGERFGSVSHKHMRYAVAAFETGSFRQAAVRLHVKESTVSRRIRDLEAVIGTPLFVRLSSGITLTRAGMRFLVLAQEALASFDAALQLATTSTTTLSLRPETSEKIVLEGCWIATRSFNQEQ